MPPTENRKVDGSIPTLATTIPIQDIDRIRVRLSTKELRAQTNLVTLN